MSMTRRIIGPKTYQTKIEQLASVCHDPLPYERRQRTVRLFVMSVHRLCPTVCAMCMFICSSCVRHAFVVGSLQTLECTTHEKDKNVELSSDTLESRRHVKTHSPGLLGLF